MNLSLFLLAFVLQKSPILNKQNTFGLVCWLGGCNFNPRRCWYTFATGRWHYGSQGHWEGFRDWAQGQGSAMALIPGRFPAKTRRKTQGIMDKIWWNMCCFRGFVCWKKGWEDSRNKWNMQMYSEDFQLGSLSFMLQWSFYCHFFRPWAYQPECHT